MRPGLTAFKRTIKHLLQFQIDQRHGACIATCDFQIRIVNPWQSTLDADHERVSHRQVLPECH